MLSDLVQHPQLTPCAREHTLVIMHMQQVRHSDERSKVVSKLQRTDYQLEEKAGKNKKMIDSDYAYESNCFFKHCINTAHVQALFLRNAEQHPLISI